MPCRWQPLERSAGQLIIWPCDKHMTPIPGHVIPSEGPRARAALSGLAPARPRWWSPAWPAASTPPRSTRSAAARASSAPTASSWSWRATPRRERGQLPRRRGRPEARRPVRAATLLLQACGGASVAPRRKCGRAARRGGGAGRRSCCAGAMCCQAPAGRCGGTVCLRCGMLVWHGTRER